MSTENITYLRCWKCNHELKDFELGTKVSRSDNCTACNASLRCCKMCKFYDKNAYNECREPVTERIVEKENANFCSYFIAAYSAEVKDEKDDQLAAANSLFKD